MTMHDCWKVNEFVQRMAFGKKHRIEQLEVYDDDFILQHGYVVSKKKAQIHLIW